LLAYTFPQLFFFAGPSEPIRSDAHGHGLQSTLRSRTQAAATPGPLRPAARPDGRAAGANCRPGKPLADLPGAGLGAPGRVCGDPLPGGSPSVTAPLPLALPGPLGALAARRRADVLAPPDAVCGGEAAPGLAQHANLGSVLVAVRQRSSPQRNSGVAGLRLLAGPGHPE